MKHIDVSQLTDVEVTWADRAGGRSDETVYVVSDEKWNREHEGFVGFLLRKGSDGQIQFRDMAHQFVWAGTLLHAHVLKVEDLQKLGMHLEDLSYHKVRMKAFEILWNTMLKLAEHERLRKQNEKESS